MSKVIFVFILLAFLTLITEQAKEHLIQKDCGNITDPKLFVTCGKEKYVYDCIANKCPTCCHKKEEI
uniref:Uncharacterized protein n=1 Tax=Meloidogyne enterolobii TaxID=390850 RepID=A0A6V7UDS0_MELEN|nr:unnamed protein product [Meloidogyne enterolobii]